MARARSIAFTVASGVLLAYLLWRIFVPFLAPIAWAAVFAILLMRGYRAILRRVRRPNLAAFVATTLTILLVVLPGALVVAAILRQGSHLWTSASDYFRSHRVASAADLFGTPIVQRAVARVTAWAPVSAADLQSWLESGLRTIASRTAAAASSLAIGFFGLAASFFIMIFTLFFFFRDGDELWKRVIAAIPGEREKTRALTARLDGVLHAVMAGTILTAIVQGAFGAIGFAIFGLPSPVVFGAAMALLSLLPIGGTAIVWLPAALILVAQGSWGRGLGLIVWGSAIVGLADNWFKPMIISGRSEMNTLPVFFGVMGGLAAFGFLGLFAGPIIVSLGIAVWETAAADATIEPARG